MTNDLPAGVYRVAAGNQVHMAGRVYPEGALVSLSAAVATQLALLGRIETGKAALPHASQQTVTRRQARSRKNGADEEEQSYVRPVA